MRGIIHKCHESETATTANAKANDTVAVAGAADDDATNRGQG